MKLSPLREISTQGGKKGMKMLMMSQCLKITEKVSFNIEKPKACVQKVLPDISLLIGQKLVENAKIQKCDIFW